MLSGVSRVSIPSRDRSARDSVESSEANGLMKRGDSVNESARPDEGETESNLSETNPPTCFSSIRYYRISMGRNTGLTSKPKSRVT